MKISGIIFCFGLVVPMVGYCYLVDSSYYRRDLAKCMQEASKEICEIKLK